MLRRTLLTVLPGRPMRRFFLGLVIMTGLPVWAAAQDSPDSVSVGAPAGPGDRDSTQRDMMDVVSALLGRPRLAEPEAEFQTRSGLVYTLLPSLGYNPAYGVFIGVSVSAAGSIGPRETTQPSTLSAGASYSSTGQVSVQLRSEIATPGNEWRLSGDWRYLDTSEDTYGLGPVEKDQSAYPMGFQLYRFYETVFRRLGKSDFNIGIGYMHDRHAKIEDTRAQAGESTPFTEYSGGQPSTTASSGLSLELLMDTRDNPPNATRGVYMVTALRSFTQGLGSNHDWQGFYVEFRGFKSLPGSRRHVLAVWNYSWFSFGPSPYFDLPAIAWDRYARTGRGYLRGRVRGNDQIYTEGEYRRTFTRDGLLGAVVFANVTATNLGPGGSFGPLDPGGGLGVRIKFNKRSDTNLALDFGWGDGGSQGLFAGLQEVF